MTVKIGRFDYSNQELFEQAHRIRQKVFVDEQHVTEDIEFDGLDSVCHHYLLFEEGKAIGTARWRETANGFKLERFAVLPSYRNRKLGEMLLKAVLNDILPTSKTIYLHAQEVAAGLYERNGFVKKGDRFEEAGIQHFYMEYKGSGVE